MFETPDDLILSYGSFFHLTTLEIWEVIQLEGLIPQHTHSVDPNSRNLICVAPRVQSDRWATAMPDAIVRIEILAQDIVTKEYGVDQTFEGWQVTEAMIPVEALQFSIERQFSLAVYDSIPASEFVRVEFLE